MFTLLNNLISPLLHLLLDNLGIVFHYRLDSHCARQQVSEACHPHIPIFFISVAEKEEALSGLEVEAEFPAFGHCVLYRLLRKITVKNIPEHYLLNLIFVFTVLLWADGHNCSLKINRKESFGIDTLLEQFDFLHKLSHSSLHFVVCELASVAVGAVPRPELTVPPLDNILVLGHLLKLFLQILRHIHGTHILAIFPAQVFDNGFNFLFFVLGY